MAFLDTVKTPNSSAAPSAGPSKSGTGFLGTVTLPQNRTASQKKDAYALDAQMAADEAKKANSVSGLFKNTLTGLWDPVKKYATESITQAKNYFSAPAPAGGLLAVPLDAGKHIIKSFKDSFNYGTEAVGQMLDDYKNGTGSTAGDVANLAKLTAATAGMLFSPVSGTFEAAQDFPVLKQVADAINVPFSVLGLAGAYGSGKVIDVLPISQASKDILKKPVADLGSLAAQVFVGGKIMEYAGDRIGKGTDITPSEATKIVADVKANHPEVFVKAADVPPGETGFTDTVQVPTKEPAVVTRQSTKVHADYLKEMGYEPYTPPKDLPVIEMGKRAPEKLPVIDYGDTAPRARKVPGDVTFEPIPQVAESLATEATKYSTAKEFVKAVDEQKINVPKEVIQPKISKQTSLEKFYETSTKPAEPVLKVNVDKPIGTGETRKSTLASKVEANAIENKLTSTFGKLPEYRRVNLKEQAEFAADIIRNDPQKALDMALGKEPVPSHILPESIFTAIEEHAIQTKNVEMMRQLATESPLSLEATAMGQRIRALGERTQDSPVRMIQDIKETRQAALEKKTKGTVSKARAEIAKDIKTEIKKSVSSRVSWEEFINEVQCKY